MASTTRPDFSTGPGRADVTANGPPARIGPAVRVCFLIERLATGGTETQLLALIRCLDRSRVRPYLALLDGEDETSRALEPADCPVIRMGVRRLRGPRALVKLLEFRRYLRRERIEVLQPYLTDSTYFGVVAGVLARVPAIVRTRNNVNHWMTPTHRVLGRMLNRFVTATVCNSEAARRAVLSDERPDPASVLVIENGVDLERFAHIPTFNPDRAPRCPRRIGMVANLRPVKGVDVFVRAAATVARRYPEATFHVAGEGDHRRELEPLIDELGLMGRLILRGRVGDIPAFLAELDVAVLSSRAEGMPNAVLEYMAAGRPIVAAAVGGVPAVVTHRAHALLVPPDEPGPLAESICLLLDDRELAGRLGLAARRRAGEAFSRSAATSRFEEIFLRCRSAGSAR